MSTRKKKTEFRKFWKNLIVHHPMRGRRPGEYHFHALPATVKEARRYWRQRRGIQGLTLIGEHGPEGYQSPFSLQITMESLPVPEGKLVMRKEFPHITLKVYD